MMAAFRDEFATVFSDAEERIRGVVKPSPALGEPEDCSEERRLEIELPWLRNIIAMNEGRPNIIDAIKKAFLVGTLVGRLDRMGRARYGDDLLSRATDPERSKAMEAGKAEKAAERAARLTADIEHGRLVSPDEPIVDFLQRVHADLYGRIKADSLKRRIRNLKLTS